MESQKTWISELSRWLKMEWEFHEGSHLTFFACILLSIKRDFVEGLHVNLGISPVIYKIQLNPISSPHPKQKVQIEKIQDWLDSSRKPLGLRFCFTSLRAIVRLIIYGFKIVSLTSALCLYLIKKKRKEIICKSYPNCINLLLSFSHKPFLLTSHWLQLCYMPPPPL